MCVCPSCTLQLRVQVLSGQLCCALRRDIGRLREGTRRESLIFLLDPAHITAGFGLGGKELPPLSEHSAPDAVC